MFYATYKVHYIHVHVIECLKGRQKLENVDC